MFETAALASEMISSSSASRDHIISTRCSPKTVERWSDCGDTCEDDGRLFNTDLTKSTNIVGVNEGFEKKVDSVDDKRV